MVIVQTVKNSRGLVEGYVVRHKGKTYNIDKDNTINLALQNRIENCTVCNRSGSLYLRVTKMKERIDTYTNKQENVEKAKSFIKKQQILGINVLDIKITENGEVVLLKVHDSNKKEIVIPSWITRLDTYTDSYGPFNNTHYTHIRIDANIKDLTLLFSGIESEELVIDAPNLSNTVDVTGMFFNCEN